jgi:ubiquinone/menaquinone biosynthesis C-methylase UbiE
MELLVGGSYEETGLLERELLKHLGLRPEHTLVDVGCGSGRLAAALKEFTKVKYWGTDVLEEALEHARRRVERTDWDFLVVSRPEIPAPNAAADWVVFFSVFTHLLDEDIFKYLREARRVAKPTGKIVCSFLDLECGTHWPTFLHTVADENPNRVLNKFTTRNGLSRLARAAGLGVVAIHDGAEKWIVVEETINGSDGRRRHEKVEFGQSVAIFDVFPEESYRARNPDVRDAIDAGHIPSAAAHYHSFGRNEGRSLA